jgi:hypothetical protein
MRFRTIALAGVAGAAAAYLFDPEDGPGRRARLREQIKSFADQRTNGRHSPRPVDTIEPRVSRISDVPDRPAPEPVVETAEPVVETAEPVVETAEPVVETAEPVAETAEPVVKTAETTPDATGEGTADEARAEASEETETKEPIRLPESSAVARQSGRALGDAWNG